MGPRSAAAALVEQQDLVARRIEQPAVIGRATGAGAAVQENGRLAVWIAAQFPIDLMAVADVEMAGLIGFDCRVEGAKLSVGHGRSPSS